MLRYLPLFLLLSAAPVTAQLPKDLLLADWERSRANVLAYVDAMPDSALSYAPTPGVRTFAQQIEHIIEDHVLMVGVGVRGLAQNELPSLGDPESYLRDKAALRRMVNQGYDFAIAAIREATPEQMAGNARIFGSQMPRWRTPLVALEHGAWTLGQVVPYLRMNGVTPPDYRGF